MEKARHLSAEEGNAVKIAPSLLVATDSLTRGTASTNTVELLRGRAWPSVRFRRALLRAKSEVKMPIWQ